MAVHPFLDCDGPIAFAHRGGAGDHPENTLPAFAAAVAMGYRYLETDVHATADGRLAAFHDAHLDRVTDRQGAIADLPWREVAAAVVGGTASVPSLDELFEAFPDARLNIDPKDDRAVDPLVEAIRHHDALDRVCVGAFSDRRIRRLRAVLGPRLCVGAGPLGVLRMRLAAWRVPIGAPDVDALQIPTRTGAVELVTPSLVDRAHRAGIAVHVWTIDEADEMRRLLDIGVDGIMTDRPAILKGVLEERGRWPT